MQHQAVGDPASEFPELYQFLGGWFHQDWPLDHTGWQPVVDEFVAESAEATVRECVDEIATLLGAGVDDAELTATMHRLGASVDPSAFDMTAASWLAAVRARLLAPGPVLS